MICFMLCMRNIAFFVAWQRNVNISTQLTDENSLFVIVKHAQVDGKLRKKKLGHPKLKIVALPQ